MIIQEEERAQLNEEYIRMMTARKERLSRPTTQEDLEYLVEIMDELITLRQELTTLQKSLIEPFPENIDTKADEKCVANIHKILEETNYSRGQIDAWEEEFEIYTNAVLTEIMPEE
jgi:hypothetical protein